MTEIDFSTVNFKASAVHGVNAFIWSKLQEHLGWTAIRGARPFTTPQQQPEFNDSGQPYIIYNYRIATVGGQYGYKEESVVYQINSTDEEDVREAINVIDFYLGAMDRSAELVNDYIHSESGMDVFHQFEYKSILPRGASGADPTDQEGGILDGTYEFAIRYTSERLLGFIPTN